MERFIRNTFLFVFSAATVVLGQYYLKGRVVASNVGTPVDSVRVVSSRYHSIAFSDKEGKFFIHSDGSVDCEPDTIFDEMNSAYLTRVTFSGARFSSETHDKKRLMVFLYDIRGKIVNRAVLSKPGRSALFNRPSPAGMYVLRVNGEKPQKVLLTGKGSGGFSRKREMDYTIRLPECPDGDSIYFCKNGYRTVALPADQIRTDGTVEITPKKWIATDLHNHSLLTDGSHTLDEILSHAFTEGGLDVFVNSEHGGYFYTDTSGFSITSDPLQSEIAPRYFGTDYIPRWYSLAAYSWPKVLGQRKRYPDKTILQGLEWNVPGHEHASVGFIHDADQPQAVAEFEYRFDENDDDTSRPELEKTNTFLQDGALAGLRWLKKRYPASSYCVINHPSRENYGSYSIADFRDFNNLAPEICFSFEGMPGHQLYYIRGSYRYGSSPRNRTWGGADHILATVGGIWDALLGEGRHFWTIIDSDFHTTVADFWPGEYDKTWLTVTDTGAQAWLSGLKNGEMFVVHGDLIRNLEFTIDDGVNAAPMGSDLYAAVHNPFLTIRFRSVGKNNNGDKPAVDHIDLIGGAITGTVLPSDSVAYNNPVNPTTRVIKRFTAENWFDEAGGWKVIHDTIPVSSPMYFRLRGTNLAPNTEGETDENGNPLVDPEGVNSEAVAWSDLWFYSNPIFVYPK